MILEINVGDSCIKKLKALQRLKDMDFEQVEMFLADALEQVVTGTILDELGMDATELGFAKIATVSAATPQPQNTVEQAQATAFDENQHSLSSDTVEDEAETSQESLLEDSDNQFDFSSVDDNIASAMSGSSVGDEDLVDAAVMDDIPQTNQRTRPAATVFTKPRVNISHA